MAVMRLDKFLTEMGVGTRSEVKKYIKERQVTINGSTALKPEQKINPECDRICLKETPLVYKKFEYYLFHKPAGCVTATKDALHKTVMDYITDTVRKDLFPAGRLDIDTEGLLLITNDGELAHQLLSPSKHVTKTYFAILDKPATQEDVLLFETGVDIGEAKLTKPSILKILEDTKIELTITEGKFHQVKRMFEAVGKKVVYLKRISIGPLYLPKDLPRGAYRPLSEEEITALKALQK